MQQQKQNQPPNSQEESVETKQKPPMYIGSVHQVYPERHFALLRIIGPMPKEGTVLISHPFDGTADRIGNLCVASGQHSRNGIIAADIRSGIVMKGDRIFQYRNIITEQEENAAEETASEESMVFEGLEQDVVLPEEIFTQDTPDYGVSRFNAITRQQPIEQEPQAPSPEEHEENLPEQEEDDTIIEPTIPNHTPGFRLQDIPDTIDGWDNM